MISLKHVSMFFLMAAPFLALAEQTGRFPENEDLAFIKQWQKNQVIAGLAIELNLSEDQLATLRSIRARVDEVKSSFAPREQVLADEVASVAATVRANLESNGSLSGEDRQLLQDIRKQHQTLAKEKHLNLGLATLGLEDVLNEDQVAVLHQRLAEERGHRQEARDRGQARGRDRGQARGRDRGQARGKDSPRNGGRSMKHRLAKVLLSDAFLDAYP